MGGPTTPATTGIHIALAASTLFAALTILGYLGYLGIWGILGYIQTLTEMAPYV